ncbi:EST1 family nonsense-mediated mRNA decay (NMD) pathway protein Ebs1 [Schizosaccharomyces osmophilus]|uniref:Nonsense-mediated mRNA decay factor n=1 Tax=Schizosaccharomyces osmophilus TaxID=2545709 RepID=A0AAE9WG97_9SCHI|nr:EST1 family nonsense-mediated mRNA decay (NMD) pathway protein Ebs1 [Schizosaccharomyces osmophilus]WBW74526.1 EST1 family nonsense-mediated mRNA decay (NMD) pathway protein Ebs1 [Schizosaccharomyces osmophilus]
MSVRDSCDPKTLRKLCEQNYDKSNALLSVLKESLTKLGNELDTLIEKNQVLFRTENGNVVEGSKRSTKTKKNGNGGRSKDPKRPTAEANSGKLENRKEWKQLLSVNSKIAALMGEILLTDVSFSLDKDILTVIWTKVHYRVISFLKHKIIQASRKNNIGVLGSLVTLYFQYLDTCVHFYVSFAFILVKVYRLQCLEPLASYLATQLAFKTSKKSHKIKVKSGSALRQDTLLKSLFSSIFGFKKLFSGTLSVILQKTSIAAGSEIVASSSAYVFSPLFESSLPDKEAHYLISTIYGSLIHVGDIYRYLAQARSPKLPDYSIAKKHYHMAAFAVPNCGVHYHQLGLIEVQNADSSVTNSPRNHHQELYKSPSSSSLFSVEASSKPVVDDATLLGVSFFFLASISPNGVVAKGACNSLLIALKRILGKPNSFDPSLVIYQKDDSLVSLILRLYALAFSDFDCMSYTNSLVKRVRFLLCDSLKNAKLSYETLLRITYCALAARCLASKLGYSGIEDANKKFPSTKLATQTTVMFLEVLVDAVNGQLPLHALSVTSLRQDHPHPYGVLLQNTILSPMVLPVCALVSFCLKHKDTWITKEIGTGLSQIYNRLTFFFESTKQDLPTEESLNWSTQWDVGLPFFFPMQQIYDVNYDLLKLFIANKIYPLGEEEEVEGQKFTKDSYSGLKLSIDSLYILLGRHANAQALASSVSVSPPATPHGFDRPLGSTGVPAFPVFSASSLPSDQSSPTSPFYSGASSVVQPSSSIASLQFGRMVDPKPSQPISPFVPENLSQMTHSKLMASFDASTENDVDRPETPNYDSRLRSRAASVASGSGRSTPMKGEKVLFRPIGSPKPQAHPSSDTSDVQRQVFLSELLKKMININNT